MSLHCKNSEARDSATEIIYICPYSLQNQFVAVLLMQVNPLVGKTDYYYARNGAWQVSLGDRDLFYFKTGQRELHRRGGYREVAYTDGTCFKIHNGSEEPIAIEMLSMAIEENIPCIYLG